MASFTAINHEGVEDTAVKMADIETTNNEEVAGAETNTTEEAAAPPTPKGKKGSKDPKVPATPRKRGRKPAAKKENTVKAENSDEDAKENIELENNETPNKKQRATPNKKARPIPTSYETACEEDKLLLRLKDQENKSWAEIATAWTEMTGEATRTTTLSTRYLRMKANLAVLSKDHESLLLKLKKEMEDKFETEKWQRIAEAMEQASGEKFPPLALQKKFKELEKKGPSDDVF
ncbi:hypothetical protein PRK78_002492 [Emydomyces testavorans]|uniref:Myb-like domain-containing protein n=1 Tax=Emydomyces testavorans TaxID=2070801 RepID=A0AAF0DF35_9EURO|nr:hypothetical protein PRK78_002492 [Emydomyces testavorans]